MKWARPKTVLAAGCGSADKGHLYHARNENAYSACYQLPINRAVTSETVILRRGNPPRKNARLREVADCKCRAQILVLPEQNLREKQTGRRPAAEDP